MKTNRSIPSGVKTILTMNFAYVRFKDGTSRALSQDQYDVIAILEASDSLRKRWRSALKLFREEKKRLDFIFRVYYPVYLVRREGKIIAVDGMGVHENGFNENILADGMTLSSKAIFQPVFGTDLCNWLGEWSETASETEEIRNGFALPPVISKEDANKIATEVKRVFDQDFETVEKLESEISELNEKYNRVLLGLIEEEKSLFENYDKKISLKSEEIEGLETYSEMKMIEQLKANFSKKLESIKQQKADIEQERQRALKSISELESERAKLLSLKNSLSSKISSLNRRLERLNEEMQILKSRGNDPKIISENLINSDKVRREIGDLQRELESCVSRFNQIAGDISALTDSLNGLDRQLANLKEKEVLLPSKEEEEVNKVRICFAGRRQNLVKELMELTEEKERALTEIRTRERQERLKHNKDLRKLRLLLAKSKEDLQALESLMLGDETDAKWETEALLIPFYVYSIEGDFRIIEPQIHIAEGGKIVRAGGTCLVRGGLDYLQGNWDVLSTLLYKAKDSFNLLSLQNRRRILSAAETLRSMRVINDFQLSYIKAVETK
ncbi:MAG: hypothetical protein ACQXXL_03110 [Candidatus Methanosuratincola sp.]|jgi:phage shock protein A